jgi:hypothetical protein
MILLFQVLVWGLLTVLVLDIRAQLRSMRQMACPEVLRRGCGAATPFGVPQGVPPVEMPPVEESPELAPSCNGVPMQKEGTIVAISVYVASDGVHLEFYRPPNLVGHTSPITALFSTRRTDKYGTIYLLTTISGSVYLVSMADEIAKQALRTFFAWRDATTNGSPEKAAAAKAPQSAEANGTTTLSERGRATGTGRPHGRDGRGDAL